MNEHDVVLPFRRPDSCVNALESKEDEAFVCGSWLERAVVGGVGQRLLGVSGLDFPERASGTALGPPEGSFDASEHFLMQVSMLSRAPWFPQKTGGILCERRSPP